MNAPTKTLILMALLAAGAAAAQTAAPERTGNLTNAGTSITNTATATYDIPNTDGTATGGTTSSNTVTTTVAAKMAFDITYGSGTDSDTTDTVAGAISSYQKTNVLPGSTVVFSYVAVNNGNASQTINLGTEASSGVTNVRYYLSNPDTNSDGKVDSNDTAVPTITSVTVAPSGDDPATTGTVETNSGMQTFWMAYDVTGAAGAVVGATPIGTGQYWNGTTNQTNVTEQKDTVAATPTYDDLWYQYSSAKIYTSTISNNPSSTPTTGGVNTPPSGGPNVPGYMNGTTPIAIAGDEQTAYPRVDTNNTNDTVVFTNTVSNPGIYADTVTLSIVPRTGLPAGYSQTVTPVAGTPGQYTVVQTNPDGTTTTATVALNTTGSTIAAGGSLAYTVTVTYPDQDSLANPHPIYVAVGVDSGNDTDTDPNDLTFDTILPGAFQFGDPAAGIAADPATAANQPGTAGSTVNFPMELANPGEYTDTYTLTGYTVVTLTDGTRQIVPVVYSGTGVSASGSTPVSVDLNNDGDTTDAGETVNVPVYATGSVNANSELALNAAVTLPTNVASTNGVNYVLTQAATSVYSNVKLQDTNDTITVAAAGTLVVGKFTASTTAVAAGSEYITCATTCTVSTTLPAAGTGYVSNSVNFTALNPTTYAPGVNYSYQIIAKNTYNTGVGKFTIKDTTPANTTFQGASVTTSGFTNTTAKVLYSTDGGTSWSAVAPATGTANVTVAVDLNGDNNLNASDVLPSGGQVELTLTVSVN